MIKEKTVISKNVDKTDEEIEQLLVEYNEIGSQLLSMIQAKYPDTTPERMFEEIELFSLMCMTSVIKCCVEGGYPRKELKDELWYAFSNSVTVLDRLIDVKYDEGVNKGKLN